MNGQRDTALNIYGFASENMYILASFVYSQNTGKQKKKKPKFADATDTAHIQQPVVGAGVWTEADSASFVGKIHDCGEISLPEQSFGFSIEKNLKICRLTQDELLHRDEHIGEFSKMQMVQEGFQR